MPGQTLDRVTWHDVIKLTGLTVIYTVFIYNVPLRPLHMCGLQLMEQPIS